MIRITITEGRFRGARRQQGQRLIWLEARVIYKLTALRGHGESYSDVILRLVELEGPILICR